MDLQQTIKKSLGLDNTISVAEITIGDGTKQQVTTGDILYISISEEGVLTIPTRFLSLDKGNIIYVSMISPTFDVIDLRISAERVQKIRKPN